MPAEPGTGDVDRRRGGHRVRPTQRSGTNGLGDASADRGPARRHAVMTKRTRAQGRARQLPPWLRVRLRGGVSRLRVERVLTELDLNTVCQGARCPNRCECWSRGTATFMILGEQCTRNCRFCAVPQGVPAPVDPTEPQRVAAAAERLGLHYVVVTSVTRDDVADGGAGHFAETIRAVRQRLPAAGVEVLTPDFAGDLAAVATVTATHPTVFNHNIETCRRLTPQVRSKACYDRSLRVLAEAARSATRVTTVKSGLMLGMGESDEEVRRVLVDLRENGVTALTIGQYLPPTAQHWPLTRYVPPHEFDAWGRLAREDLAFGFVASAPLVRSSYMAEAVMQHEQEDEP